MYVSRKVERIEDTVEACRYTKHISESIKVGTDGSRFGREGSGSLAAALASERRSSAWILYVGEEYVAPPGSRDKGFGGCFEVSLEYN